MTGRNRKTVDGAVPRSRVSESHVEGAALDWLAGSGWRSLTTPTEPEHDPIAILARLDSGGAPHRNPDGREVGSPHLHLYRERCGDKRAFAVSPDTLPNLDDPRLMLDDFMRFCNISEPPFIR